MRITPTEENYIKTIDNLSGPESHLVPTTVLAKHLHTTPAAVTDMVQRLHKKELIIHQRYQGVRIAPLGKQKAMQIIRRQRLWEVFLVNKLQLTWEQVVAAVEELEHIQLDILIEKLDAHLDYPTYNPTGKPIPNAKGYINSPIQILLDQLTVGVNAFVIAFKDGSSVFLEYLNKRNIQIGATVKVLEKLPFDQSVELSVNGAVPITLSAKACGQLVVVPC
jgi:DtxR family Mn-dependent transcriptional regulator